MNQIPIYYINLASRPDRRAFMEEQFGRLGLEATRIEAVTRGDLTSFQKDAFCNPLAALSMTEAQYVCNLSHAKAWRTFLASDALTGLFLEDDALLSASLPRFLNEISKKAPVDVLRVEAWPHVEKRYANKQDGSILEFKLRECLDRDAGAAGYTLSRRAVTALLSDPKFHHRIVDGLIFDPFGRRRVSIRYVDPGLCVQLCNTPGRGASSASDIGGIGVAAYNAGRKRRSLKARLLKQIFGWMEYDLPRTFARLSRIAQPSMSTAIQFKAD